MASATSVRHVFVDHSNIWGGVRLASRSRNPELADDRARVSIPVLDRILGGSRKNVETKIVSGGVPPGMEPLWEQYRRKGYNTQRLFRDTNWRERGVDHTIIGHMWRLLTLSSNVPSVLVLASGDGKTNEFGTSFYEVVETVLKREQYSAWQVCLASFFWEYEGKGTLRCPTSGKLKRLVESSDRGTFVNLMSYYPNLVYHERPRGE